MFDVTGFDPVEHSSPVSVEDSYMLNVWAKSSDALPSEIPCPSHPHDSSRTTPHGADAHFDYMPVCIVPTLIFLQWLYYRGVPHPKGT